MDYAAPEDEAIGVEHLLEEPKYHDLVDCVLDFDTFYLQKCFNIEKLSGVDYGDIKTDADTLQSGLNQGEKTKNEFLDRKFGETNVGLSDGTNDLPETCEDYLLDTEFDESVSDFNCVQNKGSCMENSGSDCHPTASGERQNGAEFAELSITSIPIPEAKSDEETSLLDKMTLDELHEAFKTVFGRETAVVDKLWLKHRISFGLQNFDASKNGLNLPDFRLHPTDKRSGPVCRSSRSERGLGRSINLRRAYPGNNQEPVSNSQPQRTFEGDFSTALEAAPRLHPTDNERKTGSSTSGERCRESTPLTGVFNFKTKPRDRFARRERRAYSDSSRTFSFEDNKVAFGSQDSGKKGSVVTRRSRRPTKRYIDNSLQQISTFQRRKCGISDTFSKDKILRVGSSKQQKESRQSQLGRGKEVFEGTCIQVPFGNPVEKGCLKKKVHESEDCKDDDVSEDVELCSAESADDESEDDCIAKNITHNVKRRRKHHTLWSLPEVLKLVEGVSEYGVGRWTEIKRVLFPSHAHRTSVDLKDKWRNLLRASCMRSQSKRGVEQKRKHGSHPIPQHILRRVRELAAVYPYPRERRIKVPRNVAIATPVSAPTCDNLLPVSTAVRV